MIRIKVSINYYIFLYISLLIFDTYTHILCTHSNLKSFKYDYKGKSHRHEKSINKLTNQFFIKSFLNNTAI